MVLGAVIGAAVGVGTAIFSGQQQKSAAQQANSEAKDKARKQFSRAKEEWEIDYETRRTNWIWETAKLEAQKFSERQAKQDYEDQQSKLINSAKANMAVNQAAILDRYGTEEALRAKQVSLDLGYNNATLAGESFEQLRQYMNRIQTRAMDGKALVQRTDNEGQQLVMDATLGYQRDALERDIQTVASIVGASSARASASQRQGGSSTSKRLALNSIQELGRTFGQIKMNNQARQGRIQLLNASMQGERATELGKYAIQTQGDLGAMQYGYDKYNRDVNYNLDVFQELTIPGFELANRQGNRELESLYIQTQATIDQASQPFRESIYFDPLEPIQGLKPTFEAPTKVYEPSGLDVGLNALGAGINGAMEFSYQKPGGGLGFY